MPGGAHANIYEFFPEPLTGLIQYDEDGDAILGFYFQIHNDDGNAMGRMLGPYGTYEEAEKACLRAWKTKDY